MFSGLESLQAAINHWEYALEKLDGTVDTLDGPAVCQQLEIQHAFPLLNLPNLSLVTISRVQALELFLPSRS